MAKCWEQRGCDEEMQQECPHSVDYKDNCPTKCAFAGCNRDSYELTIDAELVFDPTVDRTAAIKDGCTYCAFFLKNGPRISA
jgi:hypothetical protein